CPAKCSFDSIASAFVTTCRASEVREVAFDPADTPGSNRPAVTRHNGSQEQAWEGLGKSTRESQAPSGSSRIPRAWVGRSFGLHRIDTRTVRFLCEQAVAPEGVLGRRPPGS